MSELNEHKRYQQIDLPFYHGHIAPVLPPAVLDFHAHTWTRGVFRELPWQEDAAGGQYMVIDPDYDAQRLLEDGARFFPDRPYHAVCFGYPSPAAYRERSNEEVAATARHPRLFPLRLTGSEPTPLSEVRRSIVENGFYGYKVFLNWIGNAYNDITVEQMISQDQMALADELRLVVLLHVPRSGRLADPVVQRGVRHIARTWPNAQIVLAHCGRCYLPEEMQASVASVSDLPNVYLDASMVMEPQVFEILLRAIPSERLLFATDLPVAAMRGRRVYVMDHWVDVVLEGPPPSDFRLASDQIRATFMTWEIIMAIRRAAEMVNLSDNALRAIFYDNGMAVLNRVRRSPRDEWTPLD